MAAAAREIFPEMFMDERVARIEADVKHLQKDVTRIEQKVDKLDQKIDQVVTAIATLKNDMTAGFGALRVEMSDYRTTQLRWFIGTVIAAVGAAFSVAKYFSSP